MSEPHSPSPEAFKLEISVDRLTATLHAETGAVVTAAAVIARLKELGINGFDDGELIQTLQRSTDTALSIVVARGTPPVEPKPAKVKYHLPLSTADVGLIARAVQGQLIATIGVVTPGSDGKDVFGKAISPETDGLLKAGSGVRLDKGSFTATATGNLRESNNVLGIFPLLEIFADNQALKSALNYEGDATVRGSVPDGRNIQLTGCLMVGGAIEAAVFKANGWVHAKGGILGREKGSGTIGGDLWCRFIQGARLTVGGDVHVQSEVTNSRLSCTGRLILERGPISGGRVCGNGGITCQILGNAAGSPTVAEAGSDASLRQLLVDAKSEIDTNKKRAADIRSKVAPLMQRVKSLTPQQKEKATELLYEADTIEASLKKKMESLTIPCRNAAQRACAEISVGEIIYPGVLIRFPGVETTITAALKGPVRLYPRKVANIVDIVAEEPGGTITALPTTPIADHLRPCVDRIINERAAA